jgi:GT2 family glycosyltransferase
MGSADRPDTWNHLITVLVYGNASTAALSLTLSSLLDQTYRNIEILVAGFDESNLPDVVGFTGLRGLFAEPSLDPLKILATSDADHVWRGSHLVPALAGTTFDPDAFALLNRELSSSVGGSPPDLIVCDHDRSTEAGRQPCLLPGWDPDLIVGMDYVGTAFMASRRLIRDRRSSKLPCSLHDWLRSLAGCSVPVGHLAEPVMHLPVGPARPLPSAVDCQLPHPGSLAVVIPNRDKPGLLRRCVRFLEFSQATALELVVVDHASTEPETLALYAQLQRQYGARILRVDGGFNFSRMINLGVGATTADVVLLVNNDVEATDPRQIEMMVAHAMRPEVGVVGGCLIYPDETVQHAGVVLRPGPTAGHSVLTHHVLVGHGKRSEECLHALRTIRNYQAVTGAIIATRREVFDQVGGFDEVSLPVEYNDIDYCLRVRAAGLRVICLPTKGIIHRESATRGRATTPEVEMMRSAAMGLIAKRWREAVNHDPFCNPHLNFVGGPDALFPWAGRADVA